jgi:putative ABC transport system ATP-binding protein
VASSALIVADRLGKRYGDGPAAVDALREISFTVPEGQFLSVTGPSGCGKSTLLNLLAGLDEPTRGNVTIAGESLAALSADARCDLRLRRIGFVFQSSNLLPTFTALENVAVPLEFLGIPWRDACGRAARVLGAVRVPASAHDRRPSDLSGGEQQRTAIARALVTEPQILLADEPTGNLDSSTGRAILDLLSELNETRRLTIVMVTHSTFGATYGDRTIELADGRIAHDVETAPRARLHLVSEDDP